MSEDTSPVLIPIHELSDWIDHMFVSDWVVVSQAMIDAFGDVTDDHAWIHTDLERARPFWGNTIAHGLLVLTLFPGLMGKLYKVTGITHGLYYGFDKVRFTAVVLTGSRVRLHLAIKTIVPRGEGLLVTQAFRFEIDGAERPACVAETLGLMFPQTSALSANAQDAGKGVIRP
jgi:acyl dehydratase